MAAPPCKRYRNSSDTSEDASSEISIGPGGTFPSEDESSEENEMRDYFSLLKNLIPQVTNS